MQRKDLALRVLSTAAIMSIVTSIAAPAFADIYYIGNGSIDVVTKEDTDGKYVQVTQGGKTYTDRSNEIVIKDGNNEGNAAQKEENRIDGKKAKVAIPDDERTDTQELETTGSADAAGESQPDPDAAFTLNETGEDSAQTQQGKDTTKKDEDTTEPPTDNPKKDVVYEYDPAADPNPEQQATKLAPTSAAPAAKTNETTLAAAPTATPAADPATTTPAEGSAKKPTTNVIKVVNNWVGKAAKELKIRLSNVNIKVEQSVDKAAMDVSGDGKTKVELDGQNVLDSYGTQYPASYQAGLRKQGEGTLIITDETNDTGKEITTPKSESDTSGSLTAKGAGGNGAAGIGGSAAEGTKNITIEGYATVHATGSGNGAGIGGGGYYGEEKPGDAENIIIQGYATVDATGGGVAAGIGGGGSHNGFSGSAYNITIQGHSKVTASAYDGAAIGSGSAFGGDYGGSATGIVIRDHATVVAKSTGVYGASGYGAAIGAAGHGGKNTKAEVTIGTPGATTEDEDVNIIATGFYGSAIGNGAKDTKVTIQGHATIQTASSQNDAAIGSESGNVEVTIKDNVSIDNEDTVTHPTHPLWVSSGIGGGYIARNSGRTVKVTIDGGENGQIEIGKKSAITGPEGAISGTEVTIKDHVLLKMKKRDPHVERYILVNDAEAEVGTRSNPTAGGLVNTIGDNTELWYTDYHNKLQKIVHGKNLCTKHETNHKDATCTTPGSKTYQCTYEKENGAVNPEHKDQWVENTDIDPNAHNYVKTTVPPTCGAQGYDEYTCKNNPDHTYKDNFVAPTGNHQFNAWHQTKAPTCMEEGEEQHECEVCGKPETRKVDKLDHVEELRGAKEPTCTEPGYTGDKWCTRGDHLLEKGSVIPATGHHWKDNGDGTHTCTKCGATEGQPVNTNSALELRVVDAEGMNQPFTVSQNGTLRTYTGAYDTATLTGDLNTLRYLQDHGAQTIQFVTNGQTSSFSINDLLAQGSGSEVFYLTHRGTEEPTLLLVEADHSELVKD